MTESSKDTARFSKIMCIRKPPSELKMATVMFADIVGSVKFSYVSGEREFARLVDCLHECAQLSIDEVKDASKRSGRGEPAFEHHFRGDEICVKAYHQPNKDPLDTAYLALTLKTNWLLSNWNRERVMDNSSPPAELGIGLHTGEVVYGRFYGSKEDVAEGHTINVAKRVESHSRNGTYTKIMMSASTASEFQRLNDTVEVASAGEAVVAESFRLHTQELRWLQFPSPVEAQLYALDLSYLKRVCDLAPTPWNYWLLMEAALRQEDYDLAALAASMLLALGIDSPCILARVAESSECCKEFSRALALWQQAVKKSTHVLSLGRRKGKFHMGIGRAFERLGHYQEAETAYREARDCGLEFAPQCALILLGKVRNDSFDADSQVRRCIGNSITPSADRLAWQVVGWMIAAATNTTVASAMWQSLKASAIQVYQQQECLDRMRQLRQEDFPWLSPILQMWFEKIDDEFSSEKQLIQVFFKTGYSLLSAFD